MERRCACLLLRDADGKCLLQMRDNAPGISYPLTWDFFGGGIEDGEDIRAAAVREMQEELGVRAEPSAFALIDEAFNEEVGSQEYLLRLDRRVGWGDFRVLEGAGAGFFSLDDLPAVPTSGTIRMFLERGALA